MTASMIATIDSADKAAPSQSSRVPLRVPPIDGMTTRISTIAIAASGTLTQNTAPQAKWSSRKPPSVGPMTIPMPDTADQAPIAAARSRAGNTAAMIDNVAGMTNAPPRPITAREAMSISELLDSAAIVEPPAKTARPPIRASRRPNRSPSEPATISSAPNTSVYESVIHWRSTVEAFSTRASVGSAVLRMVLSMTTISNDKHSTSRICRRFGCPSGKRVGFIRGSKLTTVWLQALVLHGW